MSLLPSLDFHAPADLGQHFRSLCHLLQWAARPRICLCLPLHDAVAMSDRHTTCSCCSQMVRHTATSSKPLSNSQVICLSGLGSASASLTVESIVCTSAGSLMKPGSSL